MVCVVMKSNSVCTSIVLLSSALLFFASDRSGIAASVTLQAESGVLGGDYVTNSDGSTIYISITSNSTGTSPGSAARVDTFTVTFTNQSTNYCTDLWYFGDGDSSVLENPSLTPITILFIRFL